MRRFLGLAVIALLLSGCSGMKTHTEIEALKEAKAVGSPFTQRLTQEYKILVKSLQRSLDYSDTRHFAKKGLMAAEGKVVMPEPLSNWHLDRNSASQLGAARNILVATLDGGGRVQAPFESAVAQSRFDCWIEQEEEHWLGSRAVGCKTQFDKAMQDLQDRLKTALPKSVKADEALPQPPAKPKAAPVETDPSAVQANMDEGMFLVFFDFDRSTLNSSGMSVIDAIAVQARKRQDLQHITIIGHADTSGSDAYNQKLSQRRSDAVKAALAQKGVDVGMMTTEGRGEHALMVATPNNTREPANRRAEIRFE